MASTEPAFSDYSAQTPDYKEVSLSADGKPVGKEPKAGFFHRYGTKKPSAGAFIIRNKEGAPLPSEAMEKILRTGPRVGMEVGGKKIDEEALRFGKAIKEAGIEVKETEDGTRIALPPELVDSLPEVQEGREREQHLEQLFPLVEVFARIKERAEQLSRNQKLDHGKRGQLFALLETLEKLEDSTLRKDVDIETTKEKLKDLEELVKEQGIALTKIEKEERELAEKVLIEKQEILTKLPAVFAHFANLKQQEERLPDEKKQGLGEIRKELEELQKEVQGTLSQKNFDTFNERMAAYEGQLVIVAASSKESSENLASMYEDDFKVTPGVTPDPYDAYFKVASLTPEIKKTVGVFGGWPTSIRRIDIKENKKEGIKASFMWVHVARNQSGVETRTELDADTWERLSIDFKEAYKAYETFFTTGKGILRQRKEKEYEDLKMTRNEAVEALKELKGDAASALINTLRSKLVEAEESWGKKMKEEEEKDLKEKEKAEEQKTLAKELAEEHKKLAAQNEIKEQLFAVLESESEYTTLTQKFQNLSDKKTKLEEASKNSVLRKEELETYRQEIINITQLLEKTERTIGWRNQRLMDPALENRNAVPGGPRDNEERKKVIRAFIQGRHLQKLGQINATGNTFINRKNKTTGKWEKVLVSEWKNETLNEESKKEIERMEKREEGREEAVAKHYAMLYKDPDYAHKAWPTDSTTTSDPNKAAFDEALEKRIHELEEARTKDTEERDAFVLQLTDTRKNADEKQQAERGITTLTEKIETIDGELSKLRNPSITTKILRRNQEVRKTLRSSKQMYSPAQDHTIFDTGRDRAALSSKEKAAFDVAKDARLEKKTIDNKSSEGLSSADLTAQERAREANLKAWVKKQLVPEDYLKPGTQAQTTGMTRSLTEEENKALKNVKDSQEKTFFFPEQAVANAPAIKQARFERVDKLSKTRAEHLPKNWRYYAGPILVAAGIGLGGALLGNKEQQERRPQTAGEAVSWRDYVQTPERKALLADLAGNKALPFTDFIQKYAPAFSIDMNNLSTVAKLSEMKCAELMGATEKVYGLDNEGARRQFCMIIENFEYIMQTTQVKERGRNLPSYKEHPYSHGDPTMTIEKFYHIVRQVIEEADRREGKR